MVDGIGECGCDFAAAAEGMSCASDLLLNEIFSFLMGGRSEVWAHFIVVADVRFAWQQVERRILRTLQPTPPSAAHPILALGSQAPDFSLPGVDGKTHSLADYASSPVLVVVFMCNHCPIAQMYEQRVQALTDDYRDKGVAVVAIQPNDPKAIRIDELDSSDISDSLDEMKIRFEYKHWRYTYLYDGDTQAVTRAYGPQATPHVFVFDKERKLRYEGRMDNNYRKELVKTQDARNAIDAVLAGREVAVKHTGVFGCSTKWAEKSAQRVAALHKIDEQPITVDMATADDLKKLRENSSKRMTLISFWATWCGSCIDEFADLEDTYLMYKVRDFDLGHRIGEHAR